MDPKPFVGISSCLLGENVRYDGRVKLDCFLKNEMSKTVAFLPVCPETESGMSVPREPMDLFEVNGCIRLLRLESYQDMTSQVAEWIEEKLLELSKLNLSGFVFKARSPSCAVCSAVIHRETGVDNDGQGLFSKAFIERYPLLPVEEEEHLQDPVQRSRFLEKIFKIHNGS